MWLGASRAGAQAQAASAALRGAVPLLLSARLALPLPLLSAPQDWGRFSRWRTYYAQHPGLTASMRMHTLPAELVRRFIPRASSWLARRGVHAGLPPCAPQQPRRFLPAIHPAIPPCTATGHRPGPVKAERVAGGPAQASTGGGRRSLVARMLPCFARPPAAHE